MARILIIDDEKLIRGRVSDLLESAGHVVAQAEDGQDALGQLRKFNPELIIVDFVMPRLNGFQFCAALRGVAAYSDTPVILLSARTDQVGEHFIDRFKVSDAISKPFEDEALLAVVQNVQGAGAPRQQRNRWVVTREEVVPRELFKQLLQDVSGRVAGFLVDRFPDLGPRKEALVGALADGLKPGGRVGLDEWSSQLENVFARAALSGDLAIVSLPDVLQLLDMQRQTGLLEIETGGSKVTVQLRDGKVETALAEDIQPEFLLGRYLVEEEVMTRQDLDLFLEKRIGPQRLGEQLVKLDYITDAELKKVLGRQTSDLVVETFRWNKGRFRFLPGRELEGSVAVGNRFSAEYLVLEGLRRVDEWRLIEDDIPNFNIVMAVAGKGAMVDREALSYEEARVFDCVDGERTVRQVIHEADMGSFNVCTILYRLLSVKLIKPVVES